MLFLLMLLGCVKELKNEDIYKGKGDLIKAATEGRKNDIIDLLARGEDINEADSSRCTPLYVASKNGHRGIVELLLSKGAAIDLGNKNRFTPLYIASQNGHKEVVELLINKGAAINLGENSIGVTPLYIASQNGHKEVVELLLTKGAAIDLGNKNGFTPLYIASQNGHKEVVELLLSKGASIDLAINYGRTPLMLASHIGHKEVVELLIEKGANPNKIFDKDSQEKILIWAIKKNNKKIVELLLTKGAVIDLEDKHGWTLLSIASQNGQREVVELLIEKGAAIDLEDKDGWTPLSIASQNGQREVVELLLSKGASIDLAINDGRTPLYIASVNGHEEVVELLIEKGANPNTIFDKDSKETILIWIIKKNNKKIVKLLLTKGAVIDLADKDGWTPLSIASQLGEKEVVELLLEKRAAIDLANKDGATPLYMASQQGKKEVVALLLSKGATIPKSLPGLLYNRPKFIEEIVSYFKEKSLTDSSWCFTSSILLEKKHFPVIQDLANQIPLAFLEDKFFSIPDWNCYGYNSLHFSIFQDSTDSLKALLSNDSIKAFINSYDNKEKETCLSLAIKLNKLEHVKVLLSFLASPVYFKYSLLGSKQVNVLDISEIKEYVSNRMILDLLKEGRAEDAFKLLFGHIKSSSQLEITINNFSYKDIINLKAVDSEGKNVFHHLAIHAFDQDDLDHFLNRSFELKSFSYELLFAYDKFGHTPFHYALLNSNEYFVKYFLTSDNIKITDVLKNTKNNASISLFLKEKNVSKGIINLLIDYAWSIKDKNVYKFISNKKENSDEKCFLIKSKMKELVLFDKSENNIIFSILKNDDRKVLTYLLNDLNLKAKFKKEELLEIFSTAAALNAPGCLKELLPLIDKKEFLTFDSMLKACLSNKVEVLRILIDLDKTLQEEELKSNTFDKDFKLSKLIEQDKDGNTLLHHSCTNRKDEIVRELLKHKIVRENINTRNKLGNTAFHNAHLALSPSIISELKDAGADLNIRNENGKRAIDLIKDKGKVSQEELIRLGAIHAALSSLLDKEYDANYELTLHLAVEAEEEWIISDISTHGLINKVDEEGNTPLHLAVKHDHKSIVDILLKRGSNFFARNNSNETPVELIRSREVFLLIVEKALEKGITSSYLLSMADKEGNTLLHKVTDRIKIEVEAKPGQAMKQEKEEIDNQDKELLKAILDNGADKEKVNNRGEMAINIARNKNQLLASFLNAYEPNLSAMRYREAQYAEQKRIKDADNKRDRQEEKEVVDILNDEKRHDVDLSTGRKAIHVVVERNDEFAVEMLIDKGSDPNWEDNEGKNCFEIAKANNSIDAFRVLIKGNIFNELRKHVSPLYLGIEKGGKFSELVLERLKEECKKGYKINDLRKLRNDPIEKIIQDDEKDIFEKLIEIDSTILMKMSDILLKVLKDDKRARLANLLLSQLLEKSDLMEELLSYRDLEDSNILHHMLRKDRATKSFLDLFRIILENICSKDVEIQKRYLLEFDKNRLKGVGNSSVFELCLESDNSSWINCMITVFLKEELNLRIYENMGQVVISRIDDLTKKRKLAHLEEIAKYFSSNIHGIFVLSQAKEKENITSQIIYKLAEEDVNQTVIEKFLRNYHCNLYTRKDILRDKAKGYAADFFATLTENLVSMTPGVAVAELAGKVVKKVTQQLIKPELEHRYEVIERIRNIYAKGEWARGMQVRKEIIGFFEDAEYIFKELTVEQTIDKIQKSNSKLGRVVNMIDMGIAHKAKQALSKLGERENQSVLFKIGKESDLWQKLSDRLGKEKEDSIKQELQNVLEAVKEYNIVYDRYVEEIRSSERDERYEQEKKYRNIQIKYDELLDSRGTLATTVWSVANSKKM